MRFLREIKSKEEGSLIQIQPKGYQFPFLLRSKTSDIPTFYQCIYNEEYNFNFSNAPAVIVDLGANIGLTSLYFKRKYPKAKIIAVEPEDSNFEILVRNTNSYKDIHCIHSGVWNRVTDLVVVDEGMGNYGFTVKEVPENTPDSFSATSVQQIIDDFGLHKIDVLKIDIEGSEKELFESNYDWMKKVDHIIIEFHDRMKPGCSKSFFKALLDYDFEISFKGENLLCTMKH